MPRVTVNQPSNIKVQVNKQQKQTVQALSYGANSLKTASDLDMSHAQEGDVIAYKASTNSFVVQRVVDSYLTIDNGFF